MNVGSILQELRAERVRLDSAIAAIEAITSRGVPRRSTARRGGPRISAAGRRRLSLLMKQRWAQGKMRAKNKRGNVVPKPNSLKKSKSKSIRGISVAARKQRSFPMKKRRTGKSKATAKKAVAKTPTAAKKVSRNSPGSKQTPPNARPKKKLAITQKKPEQKTISAVKTSSTTGTPLPEVRVTK